MNGAGTESTPTVQKAIKEKRCRRIYCFKALLVEKRVSGNVVW